MSVADVFDEDGGEVGVGGGGEGGEGLGDLEPLDYGFTDDDAAQVQGSVVCWQDGGADACEADVVGS